MDHPQRIFYSTSLSNEKDKNKRIKSRENDLWTNGIQELFWRLTPFSRSLIYLTLDRNPVERGR